MKKEVIAVDLGGTNLRVALVKNNKIIKYIKNKTPKEKQKLLTKLCDSIKQLTNKNIKGIGVAYAGIVEKGVIKKTPNLPLKNFNLKKFIQNKFKINVEIENDANCTALAEEKLGIKKKNFIVLTLGTGIGGGIIINGKLYSGKGYGAELGHIILDNGKFFEDLASGKIVNKLSKECFGKEYTIKELIKKKNYKSKKILDKISKYLGQGIVSLINIFDPEIVILSGGIKETGKPFLNMIKKEIKKYRFLPRQTPVKWTKLKHAEILGASLLIK
ncbi:ROK family protein [Candidatus Pacearchaeota archaeon]|nr:ROK family protein [Candidatus Pacearchaeota archaeon]